MTTHLMEMYHHCDDFGHLVEGDENLKHYAKILLFEIEQA